MPPTPIYLSQSIYEIKIGAYIQTYTEKIIVSPAIHFQPKSEKKKKKKKRRYKAKVRAS